MLPLNIGIFAEYEKRFEQRKLNMVAWFALQKFVETMGDYPDTDDPAVQALRDQLWNEVIEQIDRIRGKQDNQ
jgi:aminopeptidase N